MEAIQQVLAVFAVFTLLGLSVFVLRKKGAGPLRLSGREPSLKRLQLIERLPLGPQHSLCLIRIDGQTVAISVSPAGCHPLTRCQGGSTTE